MEDFPKLKIDIPTDVAKGTYSNLAIISHTPTEITLDFAQMLPGGKEGDAIVRERIIMAPVHAKKLLQALIDNIRKYEDKFGQIVDPFPAEMMRSQKDIDAKGKA